LFILSWKFAFATGFLSCFLHLLVPRPKNKQAISLRTIFVGHEGGRDSLLNVKLTIHGININPVDHGV